VPGGKVGRWRKERETTTEEKGNKERAEDELATTNTHRIYNNRGNLNRITRKAGLARQQGWQRRRGGRWR